MPRKVPDIAQAMAPSVSLSPPLKAAQSRHFSKALGLYTIAFPIDHQLTANRLEPVILLC